MKPLRFFIARVSAAFLIVVNISCNQSGPPSQAETDLVKNAVTVDFKKAFDVNDEDAIAGMFLEDADLAFPTSPWIKGKEGIRKAFTRDQPEGFAGEFLVEDIRFLDPTIAIVNVNAHFSGGKNKNGDNIADSWDSATIIMKKQKNEWKYAALRVMPARMIHSEVQESIRKSWDGFQEKWEKGDAEGSAAYFTDYAINMVPGNENNVNRTEIVKVYKAFFAENNVENAKFNTLELDVAGPKAFEHGSFEQKVIPKKGKPYTGKGRYYAVWQLEADGMWRMHRFMFNHLPA